MKAFKKNEKTHTEKLPNISKYMEYIPKSSGQGVGPVGKADITICKLAETFVHFGSTSTRPKKKKKKKKKRCRFLWLTNTQSELSNPQ